jgi:hypothetical protein
MKKKKTPTEVIESAENPELESAYIKYPRENPEDVSLQRTPISVKHDFFKRASFQKSRRKKKLKEYTNYSDIHTHYVGLKSGDDIFTALPSQNDLAGLLSSPKAKMRYMGERDAHTGGIWGYTVIRRTQKTPTISIYSKDPVFKKDLEEYRKSFSDWNFFLYTIKAMMGKKRDLTEPLKKFCDKYHLQHRFVPAKGYYFNKELGSFISKQESTPQTLETKVAASIALTGIIGGLIFLFPNLTGNIIGNSRNTNNWIGGVLLIIGIIAGFFWVKRKK